MSEEEVLVCGIGLGVRLKGDEWFVVDDGLLPAADCLEQKGWLSRRIRDDAEWRLTDEGVQALRLNLLREAHSHPN